MGIFFFLIVPLKRVYLILSNYFSKKRGEKMYKIKIRNGEFTVESSKIELILKKLDIKNVKDGFVLDGYITMLKLIVIGDSLELYSNTYGTIIVEKLY